MDCQQHENRLKEIEAMLIGKDEVKARIFERLEALEARIEELDAEFNRIMEILAGQTQSIIDALEDAEKAALGHQDLLEAEHTPYGED